MHDVKNPRPLRELAGDTSGAAMTEYIVMIGVVGLVIAAGLLTRGDQLLFDYVNARELLLVPAI